MSNFTSYTVELCGKTGSWEGQKEIILGNDYFFLRLGIWPSKLCCALSSCSETEGRDWVQGRLHHCSQRKTWRTVRITTPTAPGRFLQSWWVSHWLYWQMTKTIKCSYKTPGTDSTHIYVLLTTHYSSNIAQA